MDNLQNRILIVDDDPFVREMIAAILSAGPTPMTVETADDGADAIRKIQVSGDFHLVISDMDMPEVNGLELIRRMADMTPDLPVIILTGNREIRVAMEAIREGASEYILKDENIEQTLPVSVMSVLEKSRLERKNRRLLAELARKNRELERLSFLDGLTHIPNRRYFDKVTRQEWARARREKYPLSLIMADIDFFKKFNDSYGHQNGDECLRKVAETLRRAFRRPGDFVARYGGEEFVAVLPQASPDGGVQVAEAMRRMVCELRIPHETSEAAPFVTLSLGVSAALPEHDISVEMLIHRADRALYLAKSGGRNRIECLMDEPDARDTGEDRDPTDKNTDR